MIKEKEVKKPSLGIALLPMVIVLVSLFFSLLIFDIDIHIPLIIGTVVAAMLAVFVLHFSWKEIEKGIFSSIASAMQAILITGIIGFIIGSWILGGIVPTVIYYGLQILSPRFFLVTCLIICSVVSVATGSSWTTVGTIGIALVGIGLGMGIQGPVTAGAVISGAYFGDKMSPFSDTTNLAPSIVGTTLFTHIRHMLFTTGVSYILAVIGFTIINFRYSAQNVDQHLVGEIMNALKGTFTINPFLMIPPLFIIGMLVFKIPAIPGLMLSVFLGILCSVIFQGATVAQIGNVLQYGFESHTGNAIIDDLLTRGGLQPMMWTLSLILCSLSFGGAMEKSGMLETIAMHILKLAKSTGSLIAATVITSIFMNIASGEQYLSILITGRMFKGEYKKRDLAPENLSRALEDGGTLTSPLIPWSTCAVAMSTYLGISTLAYLPYCLLNLINPLVSIFYGYLGITITKRKKEVEEVEEVEKMREVSS
ncbi:Na+/H+ antiporter NhaC [Anaerotignum propionicum]|uniref:Na+/H+ antiporter NhaC n=1 Tax=Anaerotignum propionicum TaxID=28446 RepID=UPI00289E803B|nr:Na+/H+ antiporter NhaC [Anaerotignum propionicum]